MESTITIEIELPVTYTASKGYPATHEDPGCPDEINDLDYSENELIRLVNTALEDKEIEGTLLDEASQAGLEYEFEKYKHLRDSLLDR